MKNELLTIGPFTIYGYGLMIALGIIAAYFTAEYRARRQKLAYEHVFYIAIWCVAGGFLSAKLLFWLTEWKSIVRDPGFLFDTLSDGFVVYGGILGGIVAGFLYSRKNHLNFLKYADLILPSVALAQGFGRIGCFLAGCCYGKETAGAISVTFTNSDFAPNQIPLIPVQLYASALDFLHFFILLGVAGYQKKDGQTTGVYLVLYSAGRFILEFFRGDLERGSVGIFSISQFISLFTCTAGVLLLAAVRHKSKA